jgi:SAM-dependent methyltransferase
VLVLLDGMPINDPLTGAADLSGIPVRSLESATVVLGADAGSGSGATAGVLSLRTRGVARGTAVSLTAGSFGQVAADLSASAVETEDPAADLLDRNIRRIEADARFAPIIESVPTRSGRARLAKLIFVLEAASGLLGKEVLALYLVAPERAGDLAGDFLGNFGGFLCRDWRANDFRAGRRDARRMLETSLSDVIRYKPDPPSAYEVEPVEPTFDSLPPDARRALERTVRAEASRLLGEIRPGPLAALFSWAWKPVVRRWLVERALLSLEAAGRGRTSRTA